MAELLDVYLSEVLIGRLEEVPDRGGRDYQFQYLPEIAARAQGRVVLSASLRGQAEIFDPMESRPFFEGLLPELNLRTEIGKRLHISESNSFGLLTELGRDCAGAVQLVPAADSLNISDSGIEWLDETELAELIRELPTKPLGVDSSRKGTRLSLAGVQQKAVLVRSPSGDFGKPLGDIPSTHILKPDSFRAEAPDLPINEFFCARIARDLGLGVPGDEIIEIDGSRCFVSQRYDRTTDGTRTIRLHQEDLCQARGFLPSFKYQSERGPGFVELAETIRTVSSRPAVDLARLFDIAVFNFMIGNSDAHGKNFSFLYGGESARLAPFYDLVSTEVYDFDADMAMSIGECFDPDLVDAGDWSDFAYDLGIREPRPLGRAQDLAKGIVSTSRTIATLAEEEGWYRPVIGDILRVISERAAALHRSAS